MTTRRRFLAISAAATAFPGIGVAQPVHTWKGIALGARATLRLAHPRAREISERVASEISRLEDIFSLYRANSAVSRLNATGALTEPPFELLACLSLASRVHGASGGRFDPTIQPLWARYANAAIKGTTPDRETRDKALSLVGWHKVGINAGAVTLRPGMSLTLNGIAQGYIADRVADLLRGEGLTDILIDTGEFRALGQHPHGGPWPVRLASGGRVPLVSRAVATSAVHGTTFDDGAQIGHILDPQSGLPARGFCKELSISARSAAVADALSSAGCLCGNAHELDVLLSKFDGAKLEAVVAA